MRMFVDLAQYLLTAAFLVAPVLFFYLIVYWIARQLMPTFRLGWKHIPCIVAAIAMAPFVALNFINRPVDLQNFPEKSVLVGLISSAAILVLAQAMSIPKAPDANAGVLIPIIGVLLLFVFAPYSWLTSGMIEPSLIGAAIGAVCLLIHYRRRLWRVLTRRQKAR